MIPFDETKFAHEELSSVTVSGTFSFTKDVDNFNDYAEFLEKINASLPEGLHLVITDTVVLV